MSKKCFQCDREKAHWVHQTGHPVLKHKVGAHEFIPRHDPRFTVATIMWRGTECIGIADAKNPDLFARWGPSTNEYDRSEVHRWVNKLNKKPSRRDILGWMSVPRG